jgi:nucleoside-diphosphate-sugar epimerase
MRVFVAGATGALGGYLVPELVAAGHDVTGTTRSPGKVAQVRAMGAEPVVVDGLDREAVIAAVLAAAPDVIVHEMTALSHMGVAGLRNVDRTFATTNALRTRGTDNLLEAAARSGTRRVVAQSNVAVYERTGGPVKTEDDGLAPHSPTSTSAQSLAAMKHVDATVPHTVPEGLVLRYGGFYGRGASDLLLDAVRKRRVPIIGAGTGIASFIEISDAASATLAAIERGAPGIYNITDSDPAPMTEWLPYLAQLLGAKPPLHIPAWIGRLLAGGFVVDQMTQWRGAANDKARKDLGWEPKYPSWREGFRAWIAG